MKFDELLKPVPELFFEKSGEPGDADILLFGAPLDKTASYRSGSRSALIGISLSRLALNRPRHLSLPVNLIMPILWRHALLATFSMFPV